MGECELARLRSVELRGDKSVAEQEMPRPAAQRKHGLGKPAVDGPDAPG